MSSSPYTNLHNIPIHPKYTQIVSLEENKEQEEKAAVAMVPKGNHPLPINDESTCQLLRQSQEILLTYQEQDAEMELALLAKDEEYYQMLNQRYNDWNSNNNNNNMPNKNDSNSTTTSTPPVKKRRRKVLSKLKLKFSDAYTLIKEGDGTNPKLQDTYNDTKNRKRGTNNTRDILHDDDTIYINIVVKHSVRMVNNELERIAKERWLINEKADTDHPFQNQFERIRHMAHVQWLRFAKLALSMDVTPEKIAVQLSNDLVRLLSPQLRQYGVEVETIIEYRMGPFFILSINVLSIDWITLMEHYEYEYRERRGSKLKSIGTIFQFTKYEVLEFFLATLYNFHWMISVPICTILYKLFFRKMMKRCIITSITDDFFQYVETNGMDMDLQLIDARYQASFMLSAIRQMRKDESELISKAQVVEEDKVPTRGPLFGPCINIDLEIPEVPSGFILPANLEDVNLEVDLPVGFLRLRKAMLYNMNFLIDAVFTDTLKYTEISSEEWDHHSGMIGLPKQEENEEKVDEKEFIGAKINYQYLMPKSAFVKANMAYEEAEIIEYNNYCFAIKRTTRNPDVPYGKSFAALTQLVVINRGNAMCHMVCSVQAEFPNGPPMVARQIKSAMRSGTADAFVKLGEAICQYAPLE